MTRCSNRYTRSGLRLLAADYRSHSCMVSVDVLELTTDGCIIDAKGHNTQARARVQIRLPGLAFMAAKIIWVYGDRAGIEFEHPLYEPVLDHLLAENAA